MRVLFVISSLNTGGAQRALSNIVTGLPGGCEIDILLNNAENVLYPYRGNLIDLKIREPSDRENALYQLKVLIKRYFALRRLKKSNGYNACISFLDSANFANIITGRKFCKTVISVRNHSQISREKAFLQPFINLIVRLFYNRACCIVAVSDGVKADLIRNLGINASIITTVYNGYDIDYIQKAAGAGEIGMRGAGGAGFAFITAGRCDKPKGQWHLIRAFAAFAEKYDSAHLVILGDGPLLEYLRELAAAYNIAGRVLLKGFVENPYSELINADAFVFPSLSEGFPNALAEAMVCGLPVIASDFRSGAREILAPDTDIDFEQKDKIELAQYGIITPVCSGVMHSAGVPLERQELFLLEAMELVYNDKDIRQRYASAAQKRVKDFSIESIAAQWVGIIPNS